jgi:hypothetical protein
MPPQTVALQREAIEPKYSHIEIMSQDIQAILRWEAWGGLDSRNQRIVFLYHFALQE